MTARALRSACNLTETVSVDTVKRELRKNGLFGRVALKKPSINKVQKKKRMKYALCHRAWNDTDWRKIIFSDESRLEVLSKSRKYVLRPKGNSQRKNYCIKTSKFSPSIMVWGAIRGDGKRVLIKCEGNVDSHEYQRILTDALPSVNNTRYVLQQDGATCHTSSSTSRFLQDKGVRLLVPWPPQSPDLNIIEHIWEILKQKIDEREPKSCSDLWNMAQEEFAAISNPQIMKLFDSLPRRMRAVLLAKGGNTEY